MSYLTKITPTQPARNADDFQCGWSVLRMLAELSLQSQPKAAKRPAAKARAPKLTLAHPAACAEVSSVDRI